MSQQPTSKPLTVVQILPALNSGGVERGTCDFARALVAAGHRSVVISNGGTMVDALEKEGTQHIAFPVHKKSLSSLLKVRALRRLLLQLDADVIHVRSRIPAWMTWLALKKIPTANRPALISTFHGLYSVSRYSAIMGCGDQVIAISECVRDYICTHYPTVDPERITIIHRGVDTEQFHGGNKPDEPWLKSFYSAHPQLEGRPMILMPGRLTRWKGQLEFIDLIDDLTQRGSECVGAIVGGAQPGKENYEQELRQLVNRRGLQDRVVFLGHRSDIANIYTQSQVVCNLSQHAEPFGRTVIEALALGIPVVSYDYGGPAESLRACFPEGLVTLNDRSALADKVESLLCARPEITLAESFTLPYQSQATLSVYHKALQSNLKYSRK